MPDSCKASYIFTVDEFARSMSLDQLTGSRKPFLTFSIGFVGFLLMFGALASLKFSTGENGAYLFYFLIGLLVFLVLFFSLIGPIKIWRLRRSFPLRPDADLLIEWEFTEDSIYAVTKLGEGSFKWRGLAKVFETTDGFLFYPNDGVFYWLPFTAFEKPECIDRVREFIIKNKCQFIQQKG